MAGSGKYLFVVYTNLMLLSQGKIQSVKCCDQSACSKSALSGHLPATMPLLARYMMEVSPILKIAACPQLSNARLVVVLSEASSNLARCLSYLSASYISLLKYCRMRTGESH